MSELDNKNYLLNEFSTIAGSVVFLSELDWNSSAKFCCEVLDATTTIPEYL